MELIKNYRHLFGTSESDHQTFYLGNDGKYYCKRYGLSLYEVNEEQVKIQAWFEANRRGWFTHLRYTEPGDWIPKLSNPEAQQHIVNNLIKTGTKFTPLYKS